MSGQLGSGASGREAAVGTNSPAGEPLASSPSFVGSARRLSAIRDVLGEGALRLAYHAAVPVVVDADLLNLLRVNFFLDDPPDVLPFEVEAELLLSPLFREIGEGLYEIDPGLRNLLLSGLHTRYGDERVRRVAVLLEQYTDAAAAWRSLPELELAQQLTALSFLDPASAERWLDVHEASAAQPSSSSASSADDGPGREWYVAMRRRVAENSDITTIDTEIRYAGEALLKLLSHGDISARLSVIRSLETLASLPDTDADEVVTVLCVFIQKWDERSPGPSKRVTLEVQAALSLIGSLPHTPFRLEGVALTGANLAGLDFSYAIFDRVMLTELDARILDLTYAQFSDVILSDANLDGAFLDEAFLEFHTLRQVSLNGVSCDGAYIAGDTIQGVTGSRADGTPLEIHSLSAEDETIGFSAELGLKEEPAAEAAEPELPESGSPDESSSAESGASGGEAGVEALTEIALSNSTMQLYLPSSPQPVGNAFFVNSNGLAVTTLHSIERQSRITVRINETSLEANLVYSDRVNDVALIKLDISDAVPLALSDEIVPRVYENVVILSPTGTKFARVTSYDASIVDPDDDDSPARIYIDELIQKGENGSAIVNSSGVAIGMLVRSSSPTSPVQYTSAVPSTRIVKDIERYQNLPIARQAQVEETVGQRVRTREASPQRTYALVVGIESYDAGPAWDLDGPADAAARFTSWLLDRGVPADQMLVFLSPLRERPLLPPGVTASPAQREYVTEAITRTLIGRRGDLLWLFWAGHGVLTRDDHLRLFYADASADDKRNLDLNSLLTALRSDLYAGFPQQIGVMDATQTYPERLQLGTTLPTETFPYGQPLPGREQFVTSAASPGQVVGNSGRVEAGLFSQFLLEELAGPGGDGWPPNMDYVVARLDQRFEELRAAGRADQTPTSFRWRRWTGGERILGETMPAPTAGAATAERRPPSNAALFELTERLLALNAMADPVSRASIVRMLRKPLAASIARAPSSRSDVLNIITRCLNYPGGLAELMEAVKLYTDPTDPALAEAEAAAQRLAEEARQESG